MSLADCGLTETRLGLQGGSPRRVSVSAQMGRGDERDSRSLRRFPRHFRSAEADVVQGQEAQIVQPRLNLDDFLP